MSSFTEPLDFELVGKDIYQTRKAFRFYFSDERTGEYVDVPSGFLSNGASIPRFIQRSFGWNPMDLRWAQAAFLHDALVGETDRQLPICNANGAKRIASWAEAATWFDKALQVKRANSQTCPRLNRRLFLLAVRAWGVMQ